MQCLLCENIIGKGRFVRPTFKCKDNIKVGSCREIVELNWMKMARRRFVVMISPERRVLSREELFRFIFCSPFLFCNLFTSFSFLFPLYSFSISFLFVSECTCKACSQIWGLLNGRYASIAFFQHSYFNSIPFLLVN